MKKYEIERMAVKVSEDIEQTDRENEQNDINALYKLFTEHGLEWIDYNLGLLVGKDKA